MEGLLTTKELWSSVIGAAIQAAATVIAVFLAARRALAAVAKSELQRARIEVVKQLMAHRGAIVRGDGASPADVAAFLSAMNSLIVVFSGDQAVLDAIRRLRLADAGTKTLALLHLFRTVGSKSGLPFEMITEDDLHTPFTLDRDVLSRVGPS